MRTGGSFDWNQLRSFLAVLDEGSLAAAARVTGISQPTLGRHIDELEADLDATLFSRGRGGMLPTETALKIAEQAREMKRSSEVISSAAADTAQTLRGTVRITASDIVSTYLLPAILAQALERYPGIEIELHASNTQENLLKRDADIAIRMTRPTQNDLIARKIGEFGMGTYAHRSYLERAGSPSTAGELSAHTIVGYDRDDTIIRGFAAAGHMVQRKFFRFRCDNQIAAWRAVCEGVGIGFGPNRLARQEPQLVRLLPDMQIPSLPVWLVSHRELRTSLRIRTVSTLLWEQLSQLDLG